MLVCSAYMLIMAYMQYSLCICLLCSAICQCRCGLAIESTIYNVLSGQSAAACVLVGLLASCVLIGLLATCILIGLLLVCPHWTIATCVLISLLAVRVLVSLLTKRCHVLLPSLSS